MRQIHIALFVSMCVSILAGCATSSDARAIDAAGPAPNGERPAQPESPSVSGVWRLVEYRDWDADGVERETLGVSAPGLFVYTPQGHMSLHIMTSHERSTVNRETSDAELGRIYKPYIGYFGTYSVDYDQQTITHHIEGAKLPNRIGRSAERAFYFEDGDLVLDFKSPDGSRFYRRLELVEDF